MAQKRSSTTMNRLAETYGRLILGIGQHDPDYVDAFYGPTEWKPVTKPTLEQLRSSAVAAAAELRTLAPGRMDEMMQLRHHYILRQIQSAISRIDLLGGRKMTFDEESRALYDAVAPTYSEEHFQSILEEVNGHLPGKGSVPARFDKFKSEFIIPKEKLDKVFSTAVAESRKRTLDHMELPQGESFTIEYVTGKSWSGYNWFKGGAHSLIQINTDLPIYIDRAIDLASHEGYPGHHVYNALLEQKLVRERKWLEFTVYALFSPQSLIAEGTANYGIEMAYPEAERVEFESASLFPLAGLDAKKAEKYYQIHTLFLKLNYAGNEAARKYLNGEITSEKAVDWLVNYALMAKQRAEQRIKFFDQYRSYVINYNLGQDMVKRYIESHGGTTANPAKRWSVFYELISSPRLPSGLV